MTGTRTAGGTETGTAGGVTGLALVLVLAHGAVMIGAVTIGAVTIGAETIDAVTIDAVTIDDGMIAGTADVTAAVTTVGDEEATNDLKR